MISIKYYDMEYQTYNMLYPDSIGEQVNYQERNGNKILLVIFISAVVIGAGCLTYNYFLNKKKRLTSSN